MKQIFRKNVYIQNSSPRIWQWTKISILKARISSILEPGDEDSKYFDPFIMGLIFLNVAAVVLETVDWIYLRYASLFDVFNIFSVAVFTVEYTLRVWSCTATRSSKIRSGAGSVS